MRGSPHHSPGNRPKHPRYEISLETTKKINGISGDEILTLQNGISVREWHGEDDLQRFAIAHTGKPKKYYLVPVTHDHEGKTFVFFGSKKYSFMRSSVKNSFKISNSSTSFRDCCFPVPGYLLSL